MEASRLNRDPMENGELHFGMPAEPEETLPAQVEDVPETAGNAAEQTEASLQEEPEQNDTGRFVLNLSEDAFSEFGSTEPADTYQKPEPPAGKPGKKKRKKRKYVKEKISPG